MPRPSVRTLACASFIALGGCAASPSTQPGQGPHQPHHPHQGGHHEGFGDARHWAPIFDDPSRDAWQRPEVVLEWVAPGDVHTIGIVGAGTGYFAVRFAREFPSAKIYANDVEPDMVRHLRSRAVDLGLGNLDPVQGTADDPAFPMPLGLVFMCDVYHHLEHPQTFFQRLADDSEARARVLIVDFKPGAAGEDAPGPPDAMRVAPEQIAETLAPLGFELVSIDNDALPYQYLVEFRAPNTDPDDGV